MPAIAFTLGKFAAAGPFALVATILAISIVGLFNATVLVQNARSQAAIEQFTKQELIATASLLDSREIDENAQPFAVLAPQLTVSNVRKLLPLFNFGNVSADPGALLSVETTLFVRTTSVSAHLTCSSAPSQDVFFNPDSPRNIIVTGQEGATVDITAIRDGVESAYTRIKLDAGAQALVGVQDAAIRLHAEKPVLCIGVSS